MIEDRSGPKIGHRKGLWGLLSFSRTNQECCSEFGTKLRVFC
jgi:hypothetical protein